MVQTLRVLGKFLGYLDFISYQSNEPAIISVSQLAVSTRQQVCTAHCVTTVWHIIVTQKHNIVLIKRLTADECGVFVVGNKVLLTATKFLCFTHKCSTLKSDSETTKIV